jgi:hypothetical protein
MTTYADYYGVLTFRPPLIYFKVENHGSWQHRDLAVKLDPFLNKYINGLDRGIFQELPIFVPDILESDSEGRYTEEEGDSNIIEELTSEPTPEPENRHILNEWREEKWDNLMVRMYDAARTHKWCIVQLYDSFPYWRVFTYKETHVIHYDNNDQPLDAHVEWCKRLPRAGNLKEHKDDLNFILADAKELDKNGKVNSLALFVNWTDDIDEGLGGTDIQAIWADNVFLRYLRLDIINNSAKSSGFYHIIWGNAVDDTTKASVETTFEKAGSGRAIGATENVIKDIISHFPANPGFAVEAYDKILKSFAGGCDLPLTYFNGEKEIGGFESGKNTGEDLQVNKKMRFVFGKLKSYILKLVEMRWGVKCEDVFPNIPEMDEDDNYDEEVIEPRENKPKEVKNYE